MTRTRLVAALAAWALTFGLAATSEAQGKGGKGGGGSTAIAMTSTHADGDIGPDGNGAYSDGDPGISIVVDGDYRMTMSCTGACTRSFTVNLDPADGSGCDPVSLGQARLSLVVDSVQSVGAISAYRPARAQIRELINGEAIGPLYTLYWGSHGGSDPVSVTANDNGWTVITDGNHLAMLQRPAAKGKTELCGYVHASFGLATQPR